ncbi:glycosyltransferase involved in cell wall biosynthesis [Halorubrum alkaliphilum]|uniref:Glycosyltransferase involved in cell wall biosynthesis n=1 Tax=Halorubrum alkaliphilum TaxID=261290 RepID=A0A8T4GKA1_9EURY|nr:glycosyltransferase family A protein [Halorubrum alkaliphilum]MBP1923821.1 glycosyltransferase involved in cell wall biosynthesis [Halorubrum alkaliphilum]
MTSLVIPVYNDPQGIRTTLESLLTQTTTNHQIVVVDNDSTDHTPEVVRSYEDDHDNLTLVHEREIQSSYAARNTGIRHSDAEILAFVDADMTVPEDWLESALDAVHAADADYMGCNVELTLPDNPPLPARYDHHTGFPVEGYLESQRFAPTCCLFVRREVFEDVGLFDHRLKSGGDKEFGNRVHDAGYDLHFAEDVTMFHPTRNGIRAHVTKDRRVGRGLCQLQRYHPDRYGTPGVPPRPSGIKRPDRSLSTRDRLAFGALSTFLTGVRALGYYEEYVTGSSSGALGDAPELAGDD